MNSDIEPIPDSSLFDDWTGIPEAHVITTYEAAVTTTTSSSNLTSSNTRSNNRSTSVIDNDNMDALHALESGSTHYNPNDSVTASDRLKSDWNQLKDRIQHIDPFSNRSNVSMNERIVSKTSIDGDRVGAPTSVSISTATVDNTTIPANDNKLIDNGDNLTRYDPTAPSLIDTMKDKVESVENKVRNKAERAVNKVERAGERIVDKAEELVDRTEDKLHSAKETVKSHLPDLNAKTTTTTTIIEPINNTDNPTVERIVTVNAHERHYPGIFQRMKSTFTGYMPHLSHPANIDSHSTKDTSTSVDLDMVGAQKTKIDEHTVVTDQSSGKYISQIQ